MIFVCRSDYWLLNSLSKKQFKQQWVESRTCISSYFRVKSWMHRYPRVNVHIGNQTEYTSLQLPSPYPIGYWVQIHLCLHYKCRQTCWLFIWILSSIFLHRNYRVPLVVPFVNDLFINIAYTGKDEMTSAVDPSNPLLQCCI